MTGYIITCLTIILSLVIFDVVKYEKSIRTRITIHKNMFAAKLLQTVVFLTINIDQIINLRGVKTDQIKGIHGTIVLCEIIYFFAEYVTSNVCVWMLVEGQYLKYLISGNILQSFKLKTYCIVSWLMPLALNIIWAATYRHEKEKICWFGYNLDGSYKILQIPRILIIFYNGIILTRVFIEAMARRQTRRIIKIKKSVKAALLYLPLIAVFNVISAFEATLDSNGIVFMLWTYLKEIFNSSQGIVMCFIYCFGNEEVWSVFLKRMRELWDYYYLVCPMCGCAIVNLQLMEAIDVPPTPPAEEEIHIIYDDMPLPDIILQRMHNNEREEMVLETTV